MQRPDLLTGTIGHSPRPSSLRSPSSFRSVSARSISASSDSRSPNLNHSKVYYRLLTYSAPYHSFYPIRADDSSLSFLHVNRIPPPGLAKDYHEYICTREGIHPSRAKLYVSNENHVRTSNALSRPNENFSLVKGQDKVELRIGGCGLSISDPLIMFLDIDPGMDRTQASLPPSALERGGRKVAKAVRRGCGVLQSVLTTCFASIQKVPKGME